MRVQLAALDFEPEIIMASYHGIPQSYFDKGDPYYCHCAKTTRLLREKLQMSPERLLMTFQSRFGPAKWLEPATDTTLKALGDKGVKSVAVVTPGFTADCLETIEEIGIENREYFVEHGGEDFARIDCLNDSPQGMAVLQAVVARELQGWI
jgi:ferrochelatase